MLATNNRWALTFAYHATETANSLKLDGGTAANLFDGRP